MKKIALVIAFLVSVLSLSAQNSNFEKIWQKLLGSENITASFTSEGERFTLNTSQKRYNLSWGENVVIFDGKDSYSYSAESNEVIIETPQGDNVLLNPTSLFKLELSQFNVENINEGEVLLTPKSSELSDIKSLVIKYSSDLKSLELVSSSGEELKIEFSAISTPSSLPEKLFIFDKRDFKKAEIVDFR